MNRKTIALRQFVATGLAVFAFLFIVGRCTGCFLQGIEKDTAAGLYEAQQLACVDKYADKPSIDKCRARVKAAWVVDAGTEGGDR